jgi:hypothetical protein
MELECKIKRGKKTKVFGASESELPVAMCFVLLGGMRIRSRHLSRKIAPASR